MGNPLSRELAATFLACAFALAPVSAVADSGQTAPARFAAPISGIVVDATGAPMGPYYPGTPSLVVISLGGRAVVVPLKGDNRDNPEGMAPNADDSEDRLYYETSDCSGTAWLPANSRYPGTSPAAVLRLHPHTDPDAATVFLPGADGVRTLAITHYKKNLRDRIVCAGYTDRDGKKPVRRVEEAIDLPSVYATPYRLQ
jgi:hypothetical protein